NGARIWDEEIKCLFFRARFLSATCIDEFVKKIFKYSSCSKEGIEDLKNYIDEKVMMEILKRYIVETNQPELQRCSTVKKLVQLIREMFKMHWRCKNVAQ
ncbi:15668_t:CDS:2, partial [Cetraspora pellucida]